MTDVIVDWIIYRPRHAYMCFHCSKFSLSQEDLFCPQCWKAVEKRWPWAIYYKHKPVYTPSPKEEKVCAECWAKFIGHKHKKFCSSKCTNRFNNRKFKIQPHEKKCEICGTKFMGTKVKRYCSERCKILWSVKSAQLLAEKRLLELKPE